VDGSDVHCISGIDRNAAVEAQREASIPFPALNAPVEDVEEWKTLQIKLHYALQRREKATSEWLQCGMDLGFLNDAASFSTAGFDEFCHLEGGAELHQRARRSELEDALEALEKACIEREIEKLKFHKPFTREWIGEDGVTFGGLGVSVGGNVQLFKP
jgi:hypothetical protein